MHALRHVLLLSLLLAFPARAQESLPRCEWCGAAELPPDATWHSRIAPADEPGEPLVVEGVVYRPDGTTPAAGIVIYAYQTNAEGIYAKRGNETGNARRHGYLRGWVRTGADGRYRFTTIRPAPYPTRSEPAHIHMTILEPGRDEYWIDSVHFEGDPLLTDEVRRALPDLGGPGIVDPTQDADGVWHARRNIVLERP